MAFLAAGVAAASLIFYQLALRQVTPHVTDRRRVPVWEFPNKIRQNDMKLDRLSATTSFAISPEIHLHIGGQGHPRAQKEVVEFPDMFNRGVLFGVSAWNPQDTPLSDAENQDLNEELHAEILRMHPPPAAVFPSVHATDQEDLYREEGFVLYFDRPSKEIERAVVALARVFGQTALYKWWPHVWGVDPSKHTTVMQSIVPVASGVPSVKGEAMARQVEALDAHADWLRVRADAHAKREQVRWKEYNSR